MAPAFVGMGRLGVTGGGTDTLAGAELILWARTNIEQVSEMRLPDRSEMLCYGIKCAGFGGQIFQQGDTMVAQVREYVEPAGRVLEIGRVKPVKSLCVRGLPELGMMVTLLCGFSREADIVQKSKFVSSSATVVCPVNDQLVSLNGCRFDSQVTGFFG